MNLGAINKNTLHYILPNKAIKSHEYKCPDCDKDLILCKGKIKRAYFRHKVDKIDLCGYYTNPTESQIHKDAKLRLKELIKIKNLKINRYCHNCKNTKRYNIPDFCDKSNICIEHKFEYNESIKFADVAYLKDDEMIQIYEIYYKHKTKENDRPEPWFEFNAKDIIEKSNQEDDDLEIKCNREKNCDECIYMENLKNNDLEKWIRIKLGQDYKNPKHTRYGRPIHQRFDISIGDYAGDEKIKNEHNKKICNIFTDDLNTNRLVLYAWKGMAVGYVVSGNDFDKFDYWNDDDGLSINHFSLPYLYANHYYSGTSISGTVRILKDLIINSLKFTPNNECKKNTRTYGICEKCGNKHKNRVVNRCNKCRIGLCDNCNKIIDKKYKKCYNCHNMKN